MDDRFSEILLETIQKDDKKAFADLMAQQPCGTFRLGRFPLLSLVYLYRATKIRRAYEGKFVRYNSWQEIYEPPGIAADFRKAAGKCLRFYLDEVVSPAEMLLILDETARLKKTFPQTHASQPAKQRMKNVYDVKYGLKLDFRGEEVTLEGRPLTSREKTKLAISILSILLCVAIFVGTPFVVNAFVPFIKDGSGAIIVSDFSKIDFASDKSYALKKDVTLPADFFAAQVNCQIDCKDKSVTVLGQNAPFGVINGKISNATFHTQTPLARQIGQEGSVEKVVVNAELNLVVTQNAAIVATENFGVVSDVQVNLSGNVSVRSPSEEVLEEGIIFAGVVAVNGLANQVASPSAAVLRCKVNFDELCLQGEVSANASFAGVAGANFAYVEYCTTSGKVASDTMDVAGICVSNSYLLSNDTNNAEIAQSSASTEWNPIACGVVLNNYYAVDSCQNAGKISSISTADNADWGANVPVAMACGVAYLSRIQTSGVTPYLLRCRNDGDLSAEATNVAVSVAGICNINEGIVQRCFNTGNVDGRTDAEQSVYAAGIVCQAYGYVYQSASNCILTAKGNGVVYAGGITAFCYVQNLQCASGGDMEVKGKSCFVGGVMGFSAALISADSVVCGRADTCVGSCNIYVTPTQNSTDAFVGGIVGNVEEIAVLNEQTGEYSYHGGGCTDSFFTGKFANVEGVRLGGVVGCCGKNVHDANSYVTSDGVLHNFQNNYAVVGCGAQLAVGSTVSGNGNNASFGEGSNLGATFAEMEIIQAFTTYKAVSALLP